MVSKSPYRRDPDIVKLTVYLLDCLEAGGVSGWYSMSLYGLCTGLTLLDEPDRVGDTGTGNDETVCCVSGYTWQFVCSTTVKIHSLCHDL